MGFDMGCSPLELTFFVCVYIEYICPKHRDEIDQCRPKIHQSSSTPIPCEKSQDDVVQPQAKQPEPAIYFPTLQESGCKANAEQSSLSQKISHRGKRPPKPPPRGSSLENNPPKPTQGDEEEAMSSSQAVPHISTSEEPCSHSCASSKAKFELKENELSLAPITSHNITPGMKCQAPTHDKVCSRYSLYQCNAHCEFHSLYRFASALCTGKVTGYAIVLCMVL